MQFPGNVRRLSVAFSLILAAASAGSSPADICTKPVLLGPATFYATGDGPSHLAVADFNEDGIDDVVVANSNGGVSGNSLSVLLGNGSGGVGDGTFSSPATYPIGSQPFTVAVADLDADGILDLAVANFGSNDVGIMKGQGSAGVGNGGFASPIRYLAGDNPYTVVAADFDGDLVPDLAVSNNATAQVAILRGLGGAVFAPPVFHAVAGRAIGMIAADFNEDSDVDLAVACPYAGQVTVLLGAAGATFGPISSMDAGREPFDLVARDFNSDNHLDLAVSNASFGGVAILDGSGSGSFASPRIYGLGINTHRVTPGDFNGDGISDLAVSFADQGTVRLLIGGGSSGMGNGSFTVSSSYSTPGFPFGSESRDFNGDGRADLVICQFTAQGFSVLLGVCEDPPEYPRLVSVRDVPNDQGGKVFVRWLRSSLDSPSARVITGYRVWRRLPPGSAMPEGRSALVVLEAQILGPRRDIFSASDDVFWEAVASLPAEGLAGYGYTAATTQDSLPGSNPYTAFFVTALTSDPYVFYPSQIDSGYSVDNLSPAVPTPFVGQYGPGPGVALHWGENAESDFRGYRLYKGNNPAFVPSETNLISAQADTGYFDASGTQSSYYKLSAVDLHYNESGYALVSPNGPTATLAGVARTDVESNRVKIVWWSSLKNTQVEIHRRTEDVEWGLKAMAVASSSGEVIHEDADVRSQGRYGYRLAIPTDQGQVFAGEVWVEVPRLELAINEVPNPAADAWISVAFSVPAPGPARIELLDAHGRLVLAQGLNLQGAGRHVTRIARSSLAPGIYFLRLRQGGSHVARKLTLVH